MAAHENPATWQEWKTRRRWPRLTSIEWALEWVVYWCRGLAIFEVLEFAGRASVAVALIVWILEADERQMARESAETARKNTEIALENGKNELHYRAWDLIYTAQNSAGDGGRSRALQDLNKGKVDLSGVPLTKAYLPGVELPRAKLAKANLSGANLSGADLREANLAEAYLDGAVLNGANLSGADLSGANLQGATLEGAILTNTRLIGARLDRANLKKADLTEARLSNTFLCRADLTEAKSSAKDLAERHHVSRICETIMPNGYVTNWDCEDGRRCPGT